MFVAGSCWNYSDVPKFMMALPVTFLVFLVLLPETPQHLLKCGKAKKAESSLKFLRGCGKSAESLQLVRHELLEMTQKIKNDSLLKRQSVYESISEQTSAVASRNDFKSFLLLLRDCCFEESFDYRSGARDGQSTQWLFCLHRVYSGNIQGIWLKSFAEHVRHHHRSHSSCRLDSVYIRNWELSEEIGLCHCVFGDCRWTAVVRGSWLYENLLRLVGFRLGADCEPLRCDFCRRSGTSSAYFRNTLRDSFPESEQPR